MRPGKVFGGHKLSGMHAVMQCQTYGQEPVFIFVSQMWLLVYYTAKRNNYNHFLFFFRKMTIIMKATGPK